MASMDGTKDCADRFHGFRALTPSMRTVAAAVPVPLNENVIPLDGLLVPPLSCPPGGGARNQLHHPEMSARSVWSAAAVACTSTLSAMAPTCNIASTRTTVFWLTWILRATNDRNPSFV